MIEKLECTCIEAYTARKMRDPNCCACSCDHNDLVEQLAKANERVKELEDKHLNLVLWHNIDPQQAKLYSDKYANKFAIENRTKALQSLLDKKCPVSGYVIRDKESREIIAEELEQLRKEQE